MSLIILTSALLPAILLWLYVWKKDPQPEPVSWLIRAVVYGILICMPAATIEMFIQDTLWGGDAEPSTLIDSITQAFLVAAVPEESVKLFALWLILRRNPYFDEHYDGIVYAVSVGLGFAAVENIFYVFSEEGWLSVAIGRALLAVPGHYAFAVLMGYYYSLHHFVDHSPKNALCILLVPVIAHGLYDSIAMSAQAEPLIGGLCFPALLWFCIKMHKSARSKILTLIEKDRQ